MDDTIRYVMINGIEVETHIDFEGDTIPAVVMEGPLMGYEILIPRNALDKEDDPCDDWSAKPITKPKGK